MKTKKWLAILAIIAIVSAVVVYNYIYQDHRDISSETPAFTLSSAAIIDAFKQNENDATQLYLNKTILVSGIVSEANKDGITIVPGIFFAFDTQIPSSNSINTGDSVNIKGRCIGYDSLLEEIKFDQSVVINN